jgi:hypothetical protein
MITGRASLFSPGTAGPASPLDARAALAAAARRKPSRSVRESSTVRSAAPPGRFVSTWMAETTAGCASSITTRERPGAKSP